MNKYVLILCIMFLVLVPIFFTPVIYGGDGAGTFGPVHSIYYDEDIDLSNEYEHYKETYDYIKYHKDNKTGMGVSQYTIGAPLLVTPFYNIPFWANKLFNLGLDGYDKFHTWSIMFGSALFTLFGLIAMFYVVRDLLKYDLLAFISTVTVWLSTNLFFYQYLQPSMSHSISFGMTAMTFAWWWFKLRKGLGKWNEWIIFGVMSGLCTIVRPQDGAVIVIPLIYFIYNQIKEYRPKQIKYGVYSFLAFLVPISVQMVVWKITRDSWFALFSSVNGGGQGLGFNVMRILYIIGHPSQRGLLFWTPIFIFVLGGLYAAYRWNDKLLAWSLGAGIFMQIFAASLWPNWYGGFSYGNRYLISSIPYWIIGFGIYLKMLARKHTIEFILLLCIILILFNMNLIYLYGSRILCGNCPASFWDIITLSWDNLGQIQNIIYKFIFQRGELI